MLITGCGGGQQTSSPTSESSVVPETSQASTPSDQTGSTPASGDFDPEFGFVAIAYAETEAVPGSQAIGLDLNDDQTWTVDVLDGTTKHEIKLSSDGMTLLEQEQEEADDEDVTRAQQAQVKISIALRRAMGEAPDSVLDEIDLSTEDGVLVWDAEFNEPDAEVYVDATTGEIIAR